MDKEPVAALPVNPTLENEIRGLIQKGKIIEAVKLTRQVTGLGLKESKDLVDAMRAGLEVQIIAIDQRKSPARGSDPDELEHTVAQLLADNKKIEAIKIYRQATGLGLKESKDAIEAYQRSGIFPEIIPQSAPGMSSAFLPTGSLEKITSLTQAGERQQAIDFYRQVNDSSLLEAERVIDGMIQDPQADPGILIERVRHELDLLKPAPRIPTSGRQSGCSRTFWLVVIGIVLFVLLVNLIYR
jgi:ribosomal protein L7/L12